MAGRGTAAAPRQSFFRPVALIACLFDKNLLFCYVDGKCKRLLGEGAMPDQTDYLYETDFYDPAADELTDEDMRALSGQAADEPGSW
jgi:hypothetical protein